MSKAKHKPSHKNELDKRMKERAGRYLTSIANSYQENGYPKQAAGVRRFIKKEMIPFLGNL
jgi:hypothetical protein